MTADHVTNIEVRAELGRLMRDFFRAVSFEEGLRPHYLMLHDLFIADGQLIKNSGDSPEITTVAQFVNLREAIVDAGGPTAFHEAELADRTEVFGNVAHRFSTYEKRGAMNGTSWTGKGVISTQFIRTPGGWKISSMAWDDERPGLTIPELSA